MIEMKITGRKSSDTPATAVREALDIKPVTESKTKEVSNKIHWVYGTNLGMIRGALSLAGLKGWAATAIHWGYYMECRNHHVACIKSSSTRYQRKTKSCHNRWLSSSRVCNNSGSSF